MNAADPVAEANKILGNVAGSAQGQSPGDSDVLSPKSPSMVISDPTDRSAMLVLIVEDNPVNLKITTLMTKKLGFQTITAANGEEALEILERRSKSGDLSPSVILMNCVIPIMDGYEATRGLRQGVARFSASLRKTPIIALMASTHKGDMERCLEAGMDDYLTKPVNKANLKPRSHNGPCTRVDDWAQI